MPQTFQENPYSLQPGVKIWNCRSSIIQSIRYQRSRKLSLKCRDLKIRVRKKLAVPEFLMRKQF